MKYRLYYVYKKNEYTIYSSFNDKKYMREFNTKNYALEAYQKEFDGIMAMHPRDTTVDRDDLRDALAKAANLKTIQNLTIFLCLSSVSNDGRLLNKIKFQTIISDGNILFFK